MMWHRMVTGLALTAIFCLFAGCSGSADESKANLSIDEQLGLTPEEASSATAGAIRKAAEKKRYLMLVFAGENTPRDSAMQDTLKAAMASLDTPIDTVTIAANAETENAMARRFGIDPTQCPILLVFAPNGVVTGGFSQDISVERIRESVTTSALMLETVGILQRNKVALVALQNSTTTSNRESWGAVSAFAKDKDQRNNVEAVKADPEAESSKGFLAQCGLTEPITEATVVVLAPPGRIGGILTGKTTKDAILGSLKACVPGGGCCP